MCKGVDTMPFETPLPPGFFDVSDITATVREYQGIPPTTIIRTDQPWDVLVKWTTSGVLTGWIAGKWDLHLYLESMGPGDDYELTDPNEHEMPLTPGVSPISYEYHPDVKGGVVSPGQYSLVFTVRYINASGKPDQMAGHWIGPILQFYKPT